MPRQNKRRETKRGGSRRTTRSPRRPCCRTPSRRGRGRPDRILCRPPPGSCCSRRICPQPHWACHPESRASPGRAPRSRSAAGGGVVPAGAFALLTCSRVMSSPSHPSPVFAAQGLPSSSTMSASRRLLGDGPADRGSGRQQDGNGHLGEQKQHIPFPESRNSDINV